MHFCHMAFVKNKKQDRKDYPGFEKLIKKSIQYIIDEYNFMNKYTDDIEEIFNWWVSNESAKVYFEKKKQLKLEI